MSNITATNPDRLRRKIILLVLFFMVIIHVVVTIAGLLLNPQEDWLRQLLILNGLGFVLGASILTYLGYALLQNYRLSGELQKLVERDRLTDVATRDFFYAQMQKDPTAYGTSLMVDIDHFKRVNDTYGHIAGDEVITRVAAVLRDKVSAEDIVCRFGGEEFLIFLKDQNESDGFVVAERMRKSIEEEAIFSDQQTVRVTVLIGGSLKERVDGLNVAIQKADEALYRAKNGGRNRTVFATDHAPDTSTIAGAA